MTTTAKKKKFEQQCNQLYQFFFVRAIFGIAHNFYLNELP